MYDTIVIGSGFGGSMVAHVLVGAGQRVLMIERGDWVRRGPHNREPNGAVFLTPHYSMESPYRIDSGGEGKQIGSVSSVGGGSVFYGCVAMRMRVEDFEPDPAIAAGSGARWPFDYARLERHYTRAEQILGVAGETGRDPTEPPRSESYPQAPGKLSDTAARIQQAAESLGLSPFRLPLAINYTPSHDQPGCVACTTCDTFACAIGAKNDLATCVLPDLIRRGMQLRTNTVATRLIEEHGRLSAVECHDKRTGRRIALRAQQFVLAGGALASPHLLLASGLHRLNPAGHTIGHYLMRHCNGVVMGLFPRRPDPRGQFHKQLGIHDFYFGHPAVPELGGKLGCIQQIQTPPVALVRQRMPRLLAPLLSPLVQHLTGLLVIAEDQPRYENQVSIDTTRLDAFGLPPLRIQHAYTQRDQAARRALMLEAKKILRRAGAWFCPVHKIKTFSHAVGTVRMGRCSETAPLDPDCRFRGLENLSVVDGSVFPTSGAVNPSLTIAAIGLRIGERLSGAVQSGVLRQEPAAMVPGADLVQIL